MRLSFRAIFVCSVAIILGQLGCGGAAGMDSNADAATVPHVNSVSPDAVAAGQASFVLNVYGSNFSSHSEIICNGTSLTTTLVSSAQLSTSIASQSIAQPTTMSISVENTRSDRMSNTVSLTVAKPVQITTTQLPAGQVSVSYSAPLSVSGGAAPYSWSIASGSLPSGLSMSSQTGAISGTPGNAGTSSFTAWVTDSTGSSAKVNLSISVTGQSSSSGSSSGSGFYGSGLGSDSLANTTVGPSANIVSYRFRAKHSGVVQQARIYLIPDHTGYAGGTAGTTQVTIVTDDGTAAHNPSSNVLATYVMQNVLSLPSPDRYFYLMMFSSPPTLTAGQLYHMVFKNIDASPTVNYLSVDALYEYSEPSPAQPTISDTDAAVLLSENGGAWGQRHGFTPIYELDFQNGVSEGIGYMEVWVGAPENISGTSAVRETFTVSGAAVKVSSASIRLARVNGNDPLTVRLENGDGSLIEQGSVPATAVPLSSSSSPSDGWVTYPFSTTYTLSPGNTYHLDFESSSTSTYQAYSIRKGGGDGFQPTTYFPDGYAEFEQNGSWVGWTQWGVINRTDGDLQFYFTVVP